MSKAALLAPKLLRCFFSECERHFRFLEQRYGYNFFCGLAEYQKNYKIIRPLKDQELNSEPFIAVMRYEKEQHAIEILYSSEQFMIEGFSYYNPVDRFSLFEILTAAKKDGRSITGDWGITSPSLIQQTVQDMSSTLEGHARLILNPGPKLLERAITIRHTRLEQSIRQHHTDNLKVMCEQAAKAFREKNYRLVVKLLEPYRSHLKKADLKKLNRAKKILLSS